jgi:hypothetical protein
MTDVATFEQHTLTLVRKKFAQVLQIPAEMIDLSVSESYFTDSLLIRFKATIYGEELPPHTETVHEQVPATWWQHFKYDYAERWWLRALVRHRPPRARTITLTATWENMAAYPWAQLRTQPTPEHLGAAVRLSWMTANLSTGGDDGDD